MHIGQNVVRHNTLSYRNRAVDPGRPMVYHYHPECGERAGRHIRLRAMQRPSASLESCDPVQVLANIRLY